QVPITKSNDTLQDRAKEILEQIGYADAPHEGASGWVVSNEYLGSSAGRAEGWRAIESGRAPSLQFWYRASPVEMPPITQTSTAPNDPPGTTAGMRVVVLDPQGRLVSLRAIPPAYDKPAAAGAPDWTRLFAAAGLPSASFQSAEPEWTPRDYA